MRRNQGRPRRYPPAQLQRPAAEIEAELVWAWLTGSEFEPGPQPSRGAGKRYKSYCPACDLVLRGAWECLLCHGETAQMGTAWRPGRKGTRTRIWDVRAHRNRRQAQHVPDVIRELGVTGLPPCQRGFWEPDPVHRDITSRGVRQRARRRRNRPA